MSKWFSGRSKGVARTLILAVAALTVAAAGCSRNEQRTDNQRVRSSTVVEPETRVDAVPEEEPAVARSQWRAVNDQARDITGNLRVSLEGARGGPVVFAFANGVTITAQPIAVTPADARSGVGGQSFAAAMGGDPRVNAHVYRVQTENLTRSATQGGLCGGEPTRHMAVSEFVDGSGRWVFKIAAFRSETPPGAPGQDPLLCNAFAFASQ